MAEKKYDDSSIKFLSVTEQMRLRPSMWGFNTASIEGLLIQLKEIIDNSADEALDKNKVYPIDVTFFVSKDKKSYQCLVQDHGRGIPVGTIDRIFVGGFSSGKYDGDYGGASTGSNGIGSKATTVFSKLFLAFTKRPDGFGYVRIEQGNVKGKHQQRKAVDKDETTVGTTIMFQPDPESFPCLENMFGEPPPGSQDNGYKIFMDRIINYPLFRSNITLTVRMVSGLLKSQDINKEPVELWKYLTDPNNFKSEVVFHADPGLTPRSYVTKMYDLKDPVWELGKLVKESTGDEDDPLSYDIDVFLDEKSLKGNNGFVGAVNFTPIIHPESSHIRVFQDTLKDQLTENVEDSEAKAFFESKYMIPFSGGISAGWLNAQFIGQDKTRFEDRRFADCYRTHLRKALRKLTEERGEAIWDNLWELIRENFEMEYAKFSRKAFKTSTSIKNLCYDLKRADSFNNCRSTNNEITELFITEGDSAAGRVKTERDGNTQALLKLSGKPINAIRSEGAKLNKNAIYQDLMMILGVNPSDKTLANMRFKYIIIMTDADADGYHIVALLLGIFYKINPLILEEGRVLVTNPPLYSLIDSDNGKVYLRDETALRDTRINAYKVLLDIDMSIDNGKTAKNLNHMQKFDFMKTTLPDGTVAYKLNKRSDVFKDICMIVERIGDIMVPKADLLNIDPMVLEQLLHVVDYINEQHVDTKMVKKILNLEDAVWDKENNVLVLVDHGMEWRIPLARLQETLKAYILPEYEQFHWRDISLFVSTRYSNLYKGQPCTFMMLYKIFKDIDGIYEITRFKGLGEMSAEAIRKTCIDKGTRCFTTVKTLGDVDRLYKMLDVDTEARKKLVNGGFIEEE